MQATNGVDVLRYTESVEVTAAASSAPEVLRGLGYWFFYGDDPIGPWIGPSRPYQSSLLAARRHLRGSGPGPGRRGRRAGGGSGRSSCCWRLVGLALAVGVYPYDDPSPFGSAPEVVPAQRRRDGDAQHAPGCAARRARARRHAGRRRARAVSGRLPRGHVPATGLVARPRRPQPAAAVAARPGPAEPQSARGDPGLLGRQAGAHLDATDDGTRVLELPGSDFTSYRWGTTIDPVTPGLTDRPIVARELVPQGSAAAWNLLKAFDGRLQAHIAEAGRASPRSLALMRAGQILVRSDLEYEHYDTPRPRDLWRFLLGAPGLGEPVRVRYARRPTRPGLPVPMLDELDAEPRPDAGRSPAGGRPARRRRPADRHGQAHRPRRSSWPATATGSSTRRRRPHRRHRAAPLQRGDDRRRADRRPSTTGAVLVVTDSNRRRAERWGTIRFTSGYTEPAGLEPLVVDRSDARLPVFPDADDDARTVAVHRGGITANATSYGGRNEYLPEDRPATRGRRRPHHRLAHVPRRPGRRRAPRSSRSTSRSPPAR